MRPARSRRGRRDLGIGDQGVDAGQRCEADELLAADLRRISQNHNIVRAPTMARLVAASSGSGVDTPWRAADPKLVPMNAMSTRRESSTRNAGPPTAAWVRPRTRPPSNGNDGAQSRESRGDGHRVGYHRDRFTGISAARRAAVAASIRIEPRPLAEIRRSRAMWSLWSAWVTACPS